MQRVNRSGWAISSAAFILLAVCPPPAGAQVISGGIFGTIRDKSGAVVPNAQVLVTSEGTGISQKLTSDQSGGYAAAQLSVGTYRVSATATGFKTASEGGVAVSVGSDVRVDLVLDIGAASETVQVTAETEDLQTTSSTVGNTVTQQLIEDLPVVGRDLLTLALLSPTVVQRGSNPVSVVSGNAYLGSNIPTISGGRGEAVSFTVGGLNINNRVFETPMEKPPLDSLAEFTVLSNNYSAEYGQGDGQIIAELRSGTNSLHGTAYEYLRNTDLDARKFLADTRDTVHFNQFGATLGGPVVVPKYNGRNRTFFFFNYEGTRNPNATDVSGLYPSSSLLSGNFSSLQNPNGSPDIIYDPQSTNSATGVRLPFPGNIIPPTRITPVAQKLLAAYDTPTPGSLTLPANVQGSAQNDETVDQYAIKFDEYARGADTFSTRYSLSNPSLLTGNLVQYATNTLNLRNQLLGETWTHIFRPTLINEFRAGYTRQRNLNVPPLAASHNLQEAAGIANPLPYNLLPLLLLNSATGSSSFTEIPTIVAGGNGQIQQQFQFVDNLSWIKGRHTIKFGGDLRRRRWDTVGVAAAGAATLSFNGIFTSQLALNPTASTAFPGGFVPVTGTGSPIADLLLGQIYEEDYGLGTNQFAFRDDEFSWFAQDSWRATPRFTVTYGLRWDYQSPIGEKYGREAWLDTNSPPCPTAGGCLLTDGVYKGVPYDPIVNPFPGVDEIRNGGQNPQYHNFGPRLAISYLLGRDTVVRAGAGIFYSIWEQYQLPSMVTAAPFGTGYQIRQSSTVLTNSDFQLTSAWTPLPTTSQGFVTPGVVSLNQIPLINNVTPRLVDASFAIQHQFSPSTTAEIGYVGKWGHDLADFAQVNYCAVPVGAPCQINPTTGQPIRVYSNFGPIYAQTTDGTSNYESGYVRFDRRFSHGMAVGANYTWSQDFSTGFDSVSDDIFQGGNDILSLIDPRLKNYKRSLLDVPNRFVAYGVYDLPFGQGKALGRSMSRTMDALVGGWQGSWVTTFQSGLVEDLSSFGANYFVSADAESELKRLNFRTTGYFFDPNLFTTTTTPWPVPPNSFRSAGINNFDISVFKIFNITERHKISFRADFYNAFNHAQFEEPESRVFEPGFGQFLLNLPSDEGNSLRPPRTIQLSARYTF